MPDGLDFFFLSDRHARKFADFLAESSPTRLKQAKQLISKDDHSNIAIYKITFMQEIVPICREDVVCLPKKVSHALGGIGPFVIVSKISSNIHVLDPVTLKHGEITANGYWENPFRSLCPASALVEFVVLDVESTGKATPKHLLAEATIARSSDLGVNDTTYTVLTHLGAQLNPGDVVFGYLLAGGNWNEGDTLAATDANMPDVILVRKGYRCRSVRRRHWELQRLPKVDDEDKTKKEVEQDEKDYENLMEELERDPELRKEVNMYRTKDAEEILKDREAKKAQKEKESDDAMGEEEEGDYAEDPEFPDVKVDELLQPLREMGI
eukprot:TRINITY_DN1836_c1_g1_i1.p1 TRINITY_DN1836_c1_g1~~TRINITY_DN1836_c1_g1_i1.p1  ORF type:complete len:324 (-),score=96.34 TRINITY_DN1836_c1_g1_i1:121-1092(-)